LEYLFKWSNEPYLRGSIRYRKYYAPIDTSEIKLNPLAEKTCNLNSVVTEGTAAPCSKHDPIDLHPINVSTVILVQKKTNKRGCRQWVSVALPLEQTDDTSGYCATCFNDIFYADTRSEFELPVGNIRFLDYKAVRLLALLTRNRCNGR
jgi:hypothetical protein